MRVTTVRGPGRALVAPPLQVASWQTAEQTIGRARLSAGKRVSLILMRKLVGFLPGQSSLILRAGRCAPPQTQA
jgi:hypothetical protein